MKVSIITACYNRESTIRNAIESVLAQDYGDIEYIIVDGASKDGTMDIVNEYRDKISTIISERDKGMYEAINKGIKASTGDVIGILNSDDFLIDNHVISKIVRKIETDNADFLYASGLFVDAKDTNNVIRGWKGGSFHRWKLRNGWLPLHPTCYIKRQLYEQLGIYNESYRIAADTDLLLRFLMNDSLKVTYFDYYVVVMRMGGLSTSPHMRLDVWREDVRVFRAHGLSPQLFKIKKVLWKVPQYMRGKLLTVESVKKKQNE